MFEIWFVWTNEYRGSGDWARNTVIYGSSTGGAAPCALSTENWALMETHSYLPPEISVWILLGTSQGSDLGLFNERSASPMPQNLSSRWLYLCCCRIGGFNSETVFQSLLHPVGVLVVAAQPLAVLPDVAALQQVTLHISNRLKLCLIFSHWNSLTELESVWCSRLVNTWL